MPQFAKRNATNRTAKQTVVGRMTSVVAKMTHTQSLTSLKIRRDTIKQYRYFFLFGSFTNIYTRVSLEMIRNE